MHIHIYIHILGSMDNTARLWDVETGECVHTLLGHTAEIVSLDFDTQGQRIITGMTCMGMVWV
ncbi:hypothetical protein EON63_06700 [archaeon]|nr:MAG: hypothetical protein EON63_06700 [archaeon]